MATETLKTYTYEEVSKHKSHDDLWVVYNGQVYNISPYIDEHPGGEEVVLDVAGTDATEAFNDIGHSDDAHEILAGLLVGKIEGGVTKEVKSIINTEQEGGLGFPVIAVAVFLIAFAAYYFLQNN
ncbi:hypothetical protein G9P44_003227 [Scheffersomyces stipitis]|nr:hypothetical protein G9P44_003227 [Scheffersomyces stipitis]